MGGGALLDILCMVFQRRCVLCPSSQCEYKWCGRRGSEWMRGLGFGFTKLVGMGSGGRVYVCGLRWCGWCRWGVGRALDQDLGWRGVMSL